MDGRLILAVSAITMALFFYTLGVWSERQSKTLKRWHVISFWLGLAFDTTGTLIMTTIAKSSTVKVYQLVESIHGASGGIAIALMIIHAIWATFILLGNDQKKKQVFHRLSIIVWLIWLIPFIVGMVMGML